MQENSTQDGTDQPPTRLSSLLQKKKPNSYGAGDEDSLRWRKGDGPTAVSTKQGQDARVGERELADKDRTLAELDRQRELQELPRFPLKALRAISKNLLVQGNASATTLSRKLSQVATMMLTELTDYMLDNFNPEPGENVVLKDDDLYLLIDNYFAQTEKAHPDDDEKHLSFAFHITDSEAQVLVGEFIDQRQVLDRIVELREGKSVTLYPHINNGIKLTAVDGTKIILSKKSNAFSARIVMRTHTNRFLDTEDWNDIKQKMMQKIPRPTNSMIGNEMHEPVKPLEEIDWKTLTPALPFKYSDELEEMRQRQIKQIEEEQATAIVEEDGSASEVEVGEEAPETPSQVRLEQTVRNLIAPPDARKKSHV